MKDNEIANNIYRRLTIPDENKQIKNKKEDKDTSCTNLKYNKPEIYAIFDTMLKEIDKEYRTTLINFAKYHLIMFAMVKIK